MPKALKLNDVIKLKARASRGLAKTVQLLLAGQRLLRKGKQPDKQVDRSLRLCQEAARVLLGLEEK